MLIYMKKGCTRKRGGMFRFADPGTIPNTNFHFPQVHGPTPFGSHAATVRATAAQAAAQAQAAASQAQAAAAQAQAAANVAAQAAAAAPVSHKRGKSRSRSRSGNRTSKRR